MKIGIIGLGKMGEALVKGLQRSYAITATTRSLESARQTSKRLKIQCHTDNLKLAGAADVIMISVKPHQAQAVLQEIAPVLNSKKLLISVCAALSAEQIYSWAGSRSPTIRAMPNTPVLVGEGMTVICQGPKVNFGHLKIASQIFGAVGKTAVVEEELMDGVTGLSGCGPAYGYLIIEALSEAGVKVGLRRETATLLAAQTLLGAAQMVLQAGKHPAALKDEVTTPAGCTVDGLMALEEGKLRVTLIKAVLAASRRSREMGRI